VYATAEVIGLRLDGAYVSGGTDRGIVSLAQNQRVRGCEVSGSATTGYLIDGAAGGRTIVHSNLARSCGQHGFDLEHLTDASVQNNVAVDNSQSSSGTYSNYRLIDIVRGDYVGNESISTDSKILRHHLMTGTCSDYHWGVNTVTPTTRFTVLTGTKPLVDFDPALTVASTAGNYTLDQFVTLLRVTSTAATRTVTLPAVNSVAPGVAYTVVDESNAAGTNNINVVRAGSDTWLGGATSKVINTNGGSLRFYSTGTVWVLAPAPSTGGGGASGGSATLTVAGSDAPSVVAARADYVCNGTNDEIKLNAAAVAASDIPGATIVTVGTFVLSDTWLVDSDYTTLMCHGSEFRAASGFAGSAILRIARPTLLRPCNRTNLYGGKFRGMGNGSAGLLGVDFRSYRGVMRETHAQGCLGYGLQARGYTSAERVSLDGIAWNPYGSAITNCKAYENNLGGLNMEGTDASVGGEGSEYFRNAGPGIRVNAVPQRISDAMIWGNRDNVNGTTKGYGIVVEAGSRFTISGCKIEQNRGGIDLQSASSIRIEDNSFASNSVSTGLGTQGEDGWTIPSWSTTGSENQTSDIRWNLSGGVPTNVLVIGNAFSDAYPAHTSKYHFEILSGTGGTIRNNMVPAGQAGTAIYSTLTPTNTWMLESGTPSAGKYLDGSGSWLPLGAAPNGSGEYINLQRDYGAVSNSDITSELTSAINDINAGSRLSYTLYLSGTGYSFGTIPTITKANVRVVLDGTLRKTTATARIGFAGSRGAAVALTANANANASTLTMASTATFSAGQFVVVRSSATENWSTAGANIGEIVRVKSKTSTVLTLAAPLVYTHLFGNTAGGQSGGQDAQAVPLTLLAGCSVEGGQVYQNFGQLTASNAVDEALVRYKYCDAPILDDVLMTGYDQNGCIYDTCVDPIATRVRCRDSYWAPGWWSYGISFRGPTRNGLVQNSSARSAGFIAGGGNADGGPLRVRILGCGGEENPEDHQTAGIYKSIFELHGDCHEWELVACYADNGNGLGFEIKGRSSVLLGPMAHDMNAGIQCFGQESISTRIYNPDIKNTNSYPIVLSNDCLVQGGRLESGGNIGGVRGSGLAAATGYPGPGNNKVMGTHFKNAGTSAAFYSERLDQHREGHHRTNTRQRSRRTASQRGRATTLLPKLRRWAAPLQPKSLDELFFAGILL
jgi:parallel beta-helix repeat protein